MRKSGSVLDGHGAARFTYPMTTTQISQTIRPGRVAATVEHNGNRLGHVICKGITFEASRKHGTDEDMRRIGKGFRSVEAAAAWVAASAA